MAPDRRDAVHPDTDLATRPTAGAPARAVTEPVPPVFPVGLVVAGRPCLVVGGGPVAARKAAALAACGADVTVVAEEPGPAVLDLARAGLVRLEARAYRPGEAAAHRLVISATGEPAVTARVVADAEAAGVWVNAADDPARCSVLLPAVLRRGPVTVAVATDGASPALASWLRDRLGGLVGSEAGTTATLLAEARAALHRRGRSTERTGFRAALDAGLVEAVRAGRVDEARRLIDEAIA